MNRTTYLYLYFLMMVILLAACMPTDPYSLQNAGNQALDAAHGYMTATAEMAIRREEAAILQQAQTQASNDNAATATAQVMVAAATSTALEHDSRATQAAATATQDAFTANATATQRAGLVIETQQAVMLAQLQAGATSTQTAILNQEESERAQLAREKVITVGLWAAVIVSIGLFIYLAFEFARIFTKAYAKRQAWIPGGESFVFDTPAGPVILDPRRMFGPSTVIEARSQTVTMPALADPHLQAMTTQAAQLVEQARAMVSGFHPPYPPNGNLPQLLEQAHPPLLPAGEGLPPHAPWRLLDEWRGAGGLPLGLEQGGLLLADPEASPHLLMAGTSGSGKTRFGLRPVITGALAAGWQAAIFDRSGLDFLPFEDHANAHIYTLASAEEAIGYLTSIYEEIVRRFHILRGAGVSTWGQLTEAPNPRLLVVFDEFANLADSLDNKGREALWRGARMIAAEGRKAGVHLALALQDPTHKSLDLRIRRNCTPIAFRVRDDDASRVILGSGGAESLAPRQFMAVVNAELHHAVAFAPSDDEIGTFLHRRRVPTLAPPEWLGLPAIPEATVDDVTVRILASYGRTGSLSATQREVFGTTGGKDFYTVREVLDVAGIATTTTTNSSPIGTTTTE